MKINLRLDLLVFSFLIGLLMSLLLKINHPLYISSIIIVVYFSMLVLDCKNNKNPGKTPTQSAQNSSTKQNKENMKNVRKNECNIKRPYKEENSFSECKVKRSFFDELNPQQIKTRFDYLYEATSHPKQFIPYTDYIHNKKHKVPHSKHHLCVSSRTYPQLSKDQINVDDCTNFIAGSPLSCNQSNSIILDGISNQRDLNLMILSDFSMPKEFNEITNKSVFK